MEDVLRPLGLVLLPQPLEDFALRGEVEELRRAGRVVAVDPPHVAYARLARLPAALSEVLADGQARRLVKALRRRGDVPRVVVIFEPAQYMIARSLLHRAPDSELWYRPTETPPPARARTRERLAELHEQAIGRTTLTLGGGAPAAEVRERLAELGLAGA